MAVQWKWKESKNTVKQNAERYCNVLATGMFEVATFQMDG
jgi:hypothetical protein